MCNNFQIVFTDTILFYWLKTVLSKGNRAKKIRENEKLKQSIDGSFLTAKMRRLCHPRGSGGGSDAWNREKCDGVNCSESRNY